MLRRHQARLSERFPHLTFRVWSSPTGELTPWQGYDLGLECEVPVATPTEEPNWLVLCVTTHHLTTTPMLQAMVSWGYSRGFLVDEGWREPRPITGEALSALDEALPRLLASFEHAVADACESNSAA